MTSRSYTSVCWPPFWGQKCIAVIERKVVIVSLFANANDHSNKTCIFCKIQAHYLYNLCDSTDMTCLDCDATCMHGLLSHVRLTRVHVINYSSHVRVVYGHAQRLPRPPLYQEQCCVLVFVSLNKLSVMVSKPPLHTR